jgi:hypothetical protein
VYPRLPGIDEDVELQPILDQLAARPPLALSLGEDTEARLPAIVGGLSVALARTFRIVEPGLKTPDRALGTRLPRHPPAAVALEGSGDTASETLAPQVRGLAAWLGSSSSCG